MKKQGCFILIGLALTQLLGCVSNLWTGASLVYDRHNVYKKLDDYNLAAVAHHELFDDKVFKQPGCYLDLAVFNNDLLLAGHVPTEGLRDLAASRLQKLGGYREFFNQVAVTKEKNNALHDSWITTLIRTQILADAEINPKEFKIITVDGIVYLMGDVIPEQAERVIAISRQTRGVIRVVKLLNYYNLSETPKPGKH
ncbi:BON domain-containing protein [Legionella sp. MW5194]|uniref:BON domain-containing protein n=1 Tax=Legionella sp. MW5194 TaxID=2662448 RepID=UPI00193DCE37|nr:BON domain-containing protein [Legionella sp. MW5194]QRN04986.1 BON domain-containing protein [Legionella sp. MW5194]